MDQYEFDPTDGRGSTAVQAKTQKEILESLSSMPDFASIINLSSYDRDCNPKLTDSQENGLCDGPNIRTRSKNGQSPGDDIPASFMMKIPYFAYKPEKNKKCQVCGKHARTPSDLLRHMRVHTGERPFPCVACNKTFKCKRSQLTHQYLSHGIKDGLSEHRLNVLDHRKTKRNPPKPKETNFLAQMPSLMMDNINTFMLKNNHNSIKPEPIPPPIDQDEDTEIMAEEEISCSNDGPVSFVGLFNSQRENNLNNLNDESQQLNLENSKTDFRLEAIQTGDGSPYMQQERDSVERNESDLNNVRTSESNIIELLKKKKKDRSKKVPILRIKTHKCTHCRRQFRSIYTLRYHLRSMHDEKVYLSPALETRLKKRRWIPPHVRLQKSKISTHTNGKKDNHHKEKSCQEKTSYSLLPTYPNEEIEQKFFAQAAQSFTDTLVSQNKPDEAVNLHVNANNSTLEIKKEKLDTYEEEINNNLTLNTEKIEKTFSGFLGLNEKEMKQLPYFASTQPNSLANTTTTFSLNTSTATNNTNPFVLPPHIFFPSSPAAEEGLLNEKPISWESLQVTSESVLISKLEAIHPGTQQKYVLYKCGLCGKAFASLRVICGHLALHNNSNKEKDCEKCGASFKWRTELDSHLECHQTSDRKFVPSSPYLPSYYVNPFPIPVVTPSEQNVLPTTRLLPYPFFPMPQQIPPLMQPGFFPFFAAAALQPQVQSSQNNNNEESVHNTQVNPTENNHPPENYEDKNSAQSCTFQCKMCPKTFDRIFSLQRHERIHSGVKACFCKICGRGFSELRNLRHHIIRFHAESAQKEPLPYRRRPNRMRNISSSQKLVSFLKKTAVRILNSMGQNKLDPPTPPEIHNSIKLETESAQESATNEPQNLSTTASTNDVENVAEKNVVTTMPKLFDATSHVTQLSPSHDLNEVPPPKLSPGLSSEVKDIPVKDTSVTTNGAVEVLQDPKRSLLGNRRKGRPFKLSSVSNQTLNLGVDDMLFPLHDSSFFGKHAAAITESSLLQATEFLNGCLKQEIAFPQLNFFNMNTQDPTPNMNIQDTPTSMSIQEPSTNINIQETPTNLNIQEPPTNEPIDMRNPVVREKANTPPKQESESIEIKDKSITLSSENNIGLNVYNESQQNSANIKLPESFESRCLFPCSYCHKSFNSIADINRHMSFHADIRPFKCPYCNYCSRTNSQLKVHMMRHEGIKHYMCQICNYNGVTQSDLNRHLKTRTHLLRSRNVCACCGTGFHTRSLSDEHYKSCHLASNGSNQDQNAKASQDNGTTTKAAVPNNRNRVTRLKQFRAPEDKIKNEFYQKLCDINNMGVTFGEFLQQSATAAMNIEK